MAYVRTARQGPRVHVFWGGQAFVWTSWTTEQATNCGHCGAPIPLGSAVVSRKGDYICGVCAPTHPPPRFGMHRRGWLHAPWDEALFREDCARCIEAREWYEEDQKRRVSAPCPHCDGTGIDPAPAPAGYGDSLGFLPTPVRNTLVRNLGWREATLERVSRMSDEELLGLRNFGVGSLRALREYVAEPASDTGG